MYRDFLQIVTDSFWRQPGKKAWVETTWSSVSSVGYITISAVICAVFTKTEGILLTIEVSVSACCQYAQNSKISKFL